MPLARRRINRPGADFWPGFVDAMATLLLVMMFLLAVFMIAQYLLARDISGQQSALSRLEAQVAELSDLLALEKSDKVSMEEKLSTLSDTLEALQLDNKALEGQLAAARGAAEKGAGEIAALRSAADRERTLKSEALARVDRLNRQIAALRRQLASIEAALEASESRDQAAKTQIRDLGERLNAALARRVQTLEKYRSDFFGRLRDILSQRSDIRIDGDRFIFQSEVLFAKGDYKLNAAGRAELNKLAEALKQLGSEIPAEINWILRVDGHTDADPIATVQFPSNWELSAARAISVVTYLITKGVAPSRLVAAGFGEFQPLDTGDSPEAYRRNRRIELKLTER